MKRKESSKPKWKLVTDFPVTKYRCGVVAGDEVRLRKELVVRDHRGKTVGVHRAGEIWIVLSGSAEPPVDVWLGRPDGERHTWTDDDDFWNWFEKVAV
jgi:hypothetical protein